MLNEQQRERALDALHDYLKQLPNYLKRQLPPVDPSRVIDGPREDRARVAVIESKLKPLVQSYLNGKTELAKFKKAIDRINRSDHLWGFKGPSGQMFFNMVLNVAHDQQECDREMKSAITLPANEEIASSRMTTFISYVQRLGDQWENAGHFRPSCPRVGSIPFFLSYFWQIQDRDTWPIYFNASVRAMSKLSLWQLSGDPAEDYISFRRQYAELSRLFTADAGRTYEEMAGLPTADAGFPFDPYGVGHVFWFKAGNPLGARRPARRELQVDNVTSTGPTRVGPAPSKPDHIANPLAATTGPESTTLQSHGEPKEQHYRIHKGATGYSYERIFGDYFPGAEEIVVEDPYIRRHYQINNFLRFCEAAVRIAKPKKITLVTCFDAQPEKDEAMAKLFTIAGSLKKANVILKIMENPDLHDREVWLSNGWKIKIGRGLDLYQRPDDWLEIGAIDLALRPCLETSVDVIRVSTETNQL